MFHEKIIWWLAQWLSGQICGFQPEFKSWEVAGLAFALVTFLNIQKSNGVSCPGCSSESQWQPADLPFSGQEWNARIVDYSSVLLQYFVASFRPWNGPLTWYLDIATHHFAKHNRFRILFSNTQCLVCFSGSVLDIPFTLSWRASSEII